MITRGAVLLAPAGTSDACVRADDAPRGDEDGGAAARPRVDGAPKPSLSRELSSLLGDEARPFAMALGVGVAALTLASTLELLVCRAAMSAQGLFTTFGSRASVALGLAVFAFVMLGLEAAVSYGGASLGRHVELRLRLATSYALPRVDDHFIRSRPTSDLAFRAHNLVTAGHLPASLLAAARATGDLAVTLAAIAWLDPRYVVPVVVGGALLAVSFALTRSRIRELDTRNQVHASRLLRLFLDALRGIRPIRLHGYQDSFRADQRKELELWRGTGEALVRTGAGLDAANGLVSTALLVTVFVLFGVTHGDPRAFVLLAFWAFRVPPSVRALVAFAQAYPVQRVALTRLLEVTKYASGAEDEEEVALPDGRARGVEISLRDVSVHVNGTALLRDVTLEVPAGQHVAIVGPSGSGKSSLVSLLLGFHAPTAGELRVDGAPLDDPWRRRLLDVTTWVDPAIHLFNASIRENVDYAAQGLPRRPFLEAAEAADLLGVLDHTSRGLDTPHAPSV